ncbi:MAG: GNAT family N-acetyltransferase [Verrucomicrobiota bacterium]
MSLEKRTGFWTQVIDGERSRVLVAVEHDEIVGWASGGESRDADTKGESEVYAIYVSPDHWTRGIGRQLMVRIENELSPFSGVRLWVLARNENAIGFYRRIGYEFDGAEKTIEIGGECLSELRLGKNASGSPV